MEIKVNCFNCKQWSLAGKYEVLDVRLFKNNIYMIKCGNCQKIRVYKLIINLESYCKFIKCISKDNPEYIIWKLK